MSAGRYFEAPEVYTPRRGDPAAVFLAGGITHCPDWQSRAAEHLLAADLIVLNPRRANFPVDDPSAARAQVKWEQDHLHLDDVFTLMWFPACDARQTVQPIALLELGQVLENPRRELFVGVQGGYPRAADVLLQVEFNRPEVIVHSDLDQMLAEVVEELAGWWR